MIANQVDDCDPVKLREFLPKGSGIAPIDPLPDSWGGVGKISDVARDSASDANKYTGSKSSPSNNEAHASINASTDCTPSISSNAIFTPSDATVKTKSEMPIPATLNIFDDILLETLNGADLEQGVRVILH